MAHVRLPKNELVQSAKHSGRIFSVGATGPWMIAYIIKTFSECLSMLCSKYASCYLVKICICTTRFLALLTYSSRAKKLVVHIQIFNK